MLWLIECTTVQCFSKYLVGCALRDYKSIVSKFCTGRWWMNAGEDKSARGTVLSALESI